MDEWNESELVKYGGALLFGLMALGIVVYAATLLAQVVLALIEPAILLVVASVLVWVALRCLGVEVSLSRLRDQAQHIFRRN